MESLGIVDVLKAGGTSPAAKGEGIVYTFYSFKGGVGRSMAVANVAALLAKAGHRCLVVDWDLEAPGIERYFDQFPSRLEGSSRETAGLLDMLEALKTGSRLDWRKCLLTARPFRTGAPIRILTSGRRSPVYSETVQGLDWGSLFEEHDLGGYLNELREEWIAEFDFVLVDSRTGINDIGSICTVLLPDVVVLLFTTNRQSLEGVIEIIGAARQARSTLPVDRARLIAVPVPARDESQGAEYERAQEWKRIFASELEDLYRDWIPRHLEPRDVLNKLYIPYITIWSFGERLPVVEREEEISDPRSVSAAYSRLATLLAHGLDWRALEKGEGYAEVARAREEVARTKDDSDRKIRKAWRQSAAISLFVSLLVFGIAAWRGLVSARRSETQRVLTLAATAEDPLLKTLLAAELGKDTGDPEDLVRLREIATAGPVPTAVFQSDTWKVTRATFGGDGQWVATADSDGALRAWSSSGTRPPVRIGVAGAPAFRRIAFSPNAGFLLALTDLQTALVYRVSSPGSPFVIENVADAIFPISSAGRLLVVRTSGAIESYLPSMRAANKLHIGDTSLLGIEVGKVYFNEDGSALCLLGSRRAEIWATAGKGFGSSSPIDRIEVRFNDEETTSAALNSGGEMLAVGFDSGKILVWLLRYHRSLLLEERIHKGSVDRIVFSPDNKEILTTSLGQARIWSGGLTSSDFWQDLPFEGGQITAATFSPDGNRILIALQDGTAFVWSKDDISSRQALRGHEGGVTSAEFSRDGSQVLTVSGSGTARVWRLREDPAAPATWQGLLNFLRQRTTACLTPRQRVQYLSESQTDAQEAFADCERLKGRSPASGS